MNHVNNKVALLADLHFGIHKNSDAFWKSQYDFFEYQFIPYIIENKIYKVIILGDVFDNRTSLNIKLKNDVLDLIKKLANFAELKIILGNHDIYNNSTNKIHSLKMFENTTNIQIIEGSDVDVIYDRKCLFVPWVTDDSPMPAITSDYDYCFGHFDILGFHFNKVNTSIGGIDPYTFTNIRKVFSGHFHKRSNKKFVKTSIEYIGSPYQLDRNDMDEDRGFAVLDFKTDNVEYISNSKSLKFIKAFYPNIPSEDIVKGNIIDIHVNENDALDESAFNKYKDEILKGCPSNIKINVLANNSLVHNEEEIKGYALNSMFDFIKTYINGLDVEDKELIVEKALSIYNSVKGEVSL